MIEFELWYLLLLPLLFAAGWWLRGVDSRQRRDESDGGPRAYFRGLNYLLNEQPDKAIDAFIEVVRLDPETIDLHFALGNLFRRRGEVDRAVRIHTHLLNRADLPSRSRAEALAELGQDFLKGGLLDRAEESFVRLLDEPRHRVEHLEQALKANRKSIRATILAGDLAVRAGRGEEAIEHWNRVGAMNADYLPVVAGKLADALDAAGRRDEALNFLRRSLLDHPSIDLLDVAHHRVAGWEGAAAAEALLREELQRHPSLFGFERLLAARAGNPADALLEPLRVLLQAQVRKLARYRCSKCGFRAREFHWQCPGCASWDSYPPRRIEELDAQ